MNQARGPVIFVALVGFALTGADPRPALAQVAAVSGVVLDAQLLRPVPGAQITVAGTEQRASSDVSGRFRVDGVAGEQVTLLVSAIGYRPLTVTAAVGASDIRVLLSAAVMSLDEVIVTGTAGEVERRAIANSVTKIDAEKQIELAPVPDVTSLINGLAPGVVVINGSGQVGAGPNIKIRGIKSFSLDQNPIIYVDGVRVDNAVGTGISVQGFGSGIVNRLNDVNPEDIESIEIIKGPAASTLYGTEASNGVIQIITKRGQRGASEWGVTVREGANWFMNAEDRIIPNWDVDPATGDTFSLNLFQSERDLGNGIFQTGHVQGYGLNVRGGTETFRYFASLDLDRDKGIEPVNFQNRIGGRANFSITPSEKLDVTASYGFTRARLGLSCEAGCGGVWFSLIFSDPSNRTTPRRGFLSAPPEVWWRAFQATQEIDRTNLSLQLQHRPISWFSQRLTVGMDRTQEDNQELIQRDDALVTFFTAAFADGSKFVNRRDVLSNTFDYSGTLTLPLDRWAEGLVSRTSFGMQYYHKLTEFVTASGDQFPAPALETVGATAITIGSDDYVENNTLGFFGQQQVALHDRIFLTGAVRADDNSAFGKDFDIVYYPKVSATWVLHEEPFFHVPLVNALKLRAAYGASGQQPQDFAALRTYAPVTGGGGVPALTPQFIGNDKLAPERGEELEVGFEAALFAERLGLDFTYFNQRTEDAILSRPLPPSLGFPGSQFVNAGEIRNRGLELQVRAQAYRSPDLAVDLNLNLAHVSNEVVDLGGIDQGRGFIQLGARQRHVPGFPVAGWWTRIVVSADIDPLTGVASNLMCDGGTGPTLPGGRPTLPGGSPVACVGAPDLHVGRSIPNLEGSFSPTVTLFGRLRLYGLIDFKTGFKKLDNNLRARCQVFRLCRENFFPQEFDPAFIAEMQQNNVIHNWIIRDAAFAKLRELSASYTMPERLAQAFGARRAVVTVAGRNLHTWTGYTGLDPEAEFVEFGFNRLEQDQTPQLAQFVFTVNVTF